MIFKMRFRRANIPRKILPSSTPEFTFRRLRPAYSLPPREHVSLLYSFLRDVTFRVSNEESHQTVYKANDNAKYCDRYWHYRHNVKKQTPRRNVSCVSTRREFSTRTSARHQLLRILAALRLRNPSKLRSFLPLILLIINYIHSFILIINKKIIVYRDNSDVRCKRIIAKLHGVSAVGFSAVNSKGLNRYTGNYI